jgi:hypothetical protein
MPTSRNGRLIDIGEVIRNGVIFDFKNWRGGTVDAEHLPQAVDHLFALFEKKRIDYVLVGGVALLQYVEGRNTQDIDFILHAEALDQLPELEVTSRHEDFARARFEGLRVDLLLTRHALFRRVSEKYSAQRPFEGRVIRCATVEGLFLLKLFALPSLYRQGNLDKVALYEADLFMLLQRLSVSLESLFDELKPHLSGTDFAEVRKIVDELSERIKRYRQKHNKKE